jgi:phosphohistidine phosphatase
MKRLILMRHAKSCWESEAMTDHERPLNKRGRRDAPRIAATIAHMGWLPSLVLSSDSARTKETWKRMCAAFPTEMREVYLPSLYHAGLNELQQEMMDIEDETVLALGHNPGWEGALSWLTGESLSMTTSNAALLSHPAASWRDALSSPTTWKLHRLLRPKEL